ncbi:hypothetical protein I580_01105 [Enterococcus caccae ATCC BAA-1240]|uniref:Uncharacterized protein n=1 Tax=Enterococcus caccae ATCC BAA-1240 TaxID=1158612 RepID=R3W9M9_9ENTE|nr:hypothetical protein UC7_02206 [Enterococcus caccae ATCC BAA-1240]EOT68722.1 hypothetical protein I580_01105 [Enterococcus caccae ATCC BAA-1240]
MTKTNKGHVFGINLAIIIYYFLPRTKISTHSHLWNMFFNFRGICVFLITITMLLITFQKFHLGKWKNSNLSRMVMSSYILYFLAIFFYLMIVEFI